MSISSPAGGDRPPASLALQAGGDRPPASLALQAGLLAVSGAEGPEQSVVAIGHLSAGGLRVLVQRWGWGQSTSASTMPASTSAGVAYSRTLRGRRLS